MQRMVVILTALVAFGTIAASGCGSPAPPAPRHDAGGPVADSRNIVAQSVFGAAHVEANLNQCAGRIELHQGAATVNDACFTGDTDVVVCTDASAPNPVMCAAHRGALTVAGTGTDTVSFARVQ